MTNLSRSLVLGCSILALAACGPEDLGSPGSNGDINIGDIDNSVTTPAPTSTATPAPTGVTPAAGCPTIGTDALVDGGTISGPTGTYRVCALPTVFTDDATLRYVPGLLYAMGGRVDVGADDGPTADAADGITGSTVTLEIEPGVTIYGATGRSYMVVQRGSAIEAEGTKDRPIIFTSRDNVIGTVNNSSSQQWGGLVLLGRAPVSDCSSGTPNTTAPVPAADQLACQQELEGDPNPPSFGGNTPDDSSGSLEYVQLRYSGFTLASGSELQSLTTGGVGSGTNFNYIQSFNSSDDGIEIFGGVTDMAHTVIIGAEDDSYDVDSGAKADFQYALAVHRAGAGDNMIELDSPDDDYDFNAIPRTYMRMANATLISQSGSQAIRIRGQADFLMVNSVVVKDGNCLRVDEETGATTGQDEEGPPEFISVAFDCTTTAALTTYAASGSNKLDYTATIQSLFLNGASEEGFTPIFDVTPLSTFFEPTSYVGAVSPTDNWVQGWTCDSATVNFGSGRSCLTLPVYN